MKKYLNSVEEIIDELLKNKKVYLKIGDIDSEIYLYKNFICTKETYPEDLPRIYFVPHCLEIITNAYFIEEPTPLKFEVNALYKTSKNKKAFLYKIINGADFPNYFSSEDGCFSTDINGVFYNFGVPTNDKIVGYWEEEE